MASAACWWASASSLQGGLLSVDSSSQCSCFKFHQASYKVTCGALRALMLLFLWNNVGHLVSLGIGPFQDSSNIHVTAHKTRQVTRSMWNARCLIRLDKEQSRSINKKATHRTFTMGCRSQNARPIVLWIRCGHQWAQSSVGISGAVYLKWKSIPKYASVLGPKLSSR